MEEFEIETFTRQGNCIGKSAVNQYFQTILKLEGNLKKVNCKERICRVPLKMQAQGFYYQLIFVILEF